MKRFWACLAMLTLPLGIGCGDTATESDEGNLDVADNTDVQAISAVSAGQITADRFDFKNCHFYDKEANPNSPRFNFTSKADCTEMLIAGLKAPMVNSYTEPLAWIRENNGDIEDVSVRHWCGQVKIVVAVKAAAWDSPSFKGIGFYGFDSIVNSDTNKQRTFYKKDDSRLKRVGEGRLKQENGQKVYLYEFAGAGPCEVNGSGSEPVGQFLTFKPYMAYEGDIERWESVGVHDHRIEFRKSWSRAGDLLE